MFDNDLLQEEISNLETALKNTMEIDSIKDEQLRNYEGIIREERQVRQNLQTTVKRQQYITGGSIFVSVLLAVLCLIK